MIATMLLPLAVSAAAATAPLPPLTARAAAGDAQTVVTRSFHARRPRLQPCKPVGGGFVCVARWRVGTRNARAHVSITRGQSGSSVVDHYDATRVLRGRRTHVSGNLVVATIPQPGHSRDDPLPFGTTATIGHWQLEVLSTTPDATDEVMNESQYNAAPAAGHQFYIARLQATYTGTTSASFSELSPNTVGPSSVAYTTYGDTCGMIPDPISINDVFPGGTVTGNVCWSVLTDDVTGLVMYVSPSDGGRSTFLALGS